MNMSVDEIRRIIKEVDEKYEDIESEYGETSFYSWLGEGEVVSADNCDENDPYKLYFKELEEKLGKIEFVESKRSVGSGDYDGWYWVFKIGGRLFKLEGYYSSYGGCDCNDPYSFYEVEENTKVVKYYNKKEEAVK